MGKDTSTAKPITVVREEFLTKLAELINKTELPAFAVEDVLKDFVTQIHTISQQQLELDKKAYQESMQAGNTK